MAIGAPAGARADETIVSPGPIQSLWVGADLACQVSYQQGGTYEFFPPDTAPGDCGTFVEVGGRLYAPDFDAHDGTATKFNATPFSLISESLAGSGTVDDPSVVTTEVGAGPLQLQQRVSYVHGASSYRVDISIRNTSEDFVEFRLWHAVDCYASGSDIGYGFRRPEIKSAGCAQSVDNSPPGRTIQMLPRSAGSHSYEAGFRQVWDWIDSQQDFDDTCRCGESIDNGVGLSFHRTFGALQTASLSLEVAFTEATPPAPLADSDGDTLPDQWESGQLPTGDEQNLGAMGANPGVKDVFVQADWTPGCKPPGDWVRRAVEMFAQHGIALHVDSGADSINANYQPWGALSRAGEVRTALPVEFAGALPHVDVRENYAQVDAAKDENFIPAGRRRAFHYVLFAPLIWFAGHAHPESGGQSRGIPDADLVIANCTLKPRADVTLFVHELGHNLGLFHGGNEPKNYKANYFSTMNYGWSLWAVGDEKRFVPYSSGNLAAIDENNISERDGIPAPAYWVCKPKGETIYRSNNILGRAGTRLRDWDIDCDNTYSEKKISLDLNNDGALETLTDFNDWAGLRFGGGGVLGSQALPARVDTPQPPEFTEPEIATAKASEVAATAAMTKQLRVITKTRQVKRPKNRHRSNTLKLTVETAAGKKVRNAVVRISGGKVTGTRKTKLKTDRKGRLTVHVQIKSKQQLKVTAQRGGYHRAILLIPIVKR